MPQDRLSQAGTYAIHRLVFRPHKKRAQRASFPQRATCFPALLLFPAQEGSGCSISTLWGKAVCCRLQPPTPLTID
jgi:hypothetical protein